MLLRSAASYVVKCVSLWFAGPHLRALGKKVASVTVPWVCLGLLILSLAVAGAECCLNMLDHWQAAPAKQEALSSAPAPTNSRPGTPGSPSPEQMAMKMLGTQMAMPSWAKDATTNDAQSAMMSLATGRLAKGSEAPDIKLGGLPGRETFQLRSYRKVKPVVLIFGNFVGDVLDDYLPELNRVHEQYKDRAAFALIIAHPGFVFPGLENMAMDTAGSRDMLAQYGQRCKHLMQGLTLPTFFDSPPYAASRACKAWPARLVLVNSEGCVEQDFGPTYPNRKCWAMAEVSKAVRLLCETPAGTPVTPKGASIH